MVSPFDAQAAWNNECRMRQDRLFAAADIVIATCYEYTMACIFRRNRYLVDNADLLLAAYDGKPGGTAKTVQYAKEAQSSVSCRSSILHEISVSMVSDRYKIEYNIATSNLLYYNTIDIHPAIWGTERYFFECQAGTQISGQNRQGQLSQ